MAGKKGRSGRPPKRIETGNLDPVKSIKNNVNMKLESYIRYVLKIPNEELTTTQQQQLITLHMKHTRDPKNESETTALDILGKLALEGAREYAKLKAERVQDTHTRVINDAEWQVVDDNDNASDANDNASSVNNEHDISTNTTIECNHDDASDNGEPTGSSAQ